MDAERGGGLGQPARGSDLGRGRAAAAPPLKEFDVSPVTGNKIVLRDGKFGLYVNDGETNASLPKDMSGDDLTFEQAVDLLAARAAAGGSKKKKKSSKKAASSQAQLTYKCPICPPSLQWVQP
jgi:DNA topoisomerase-1